MAEQTLGSTAPQTFSEVIERYPGMDPQLAVITAGLAQAHGEPPFEQGALAEAERPDARWGAVAEHVPKTPEHASRDTAEGEAVVPGYDQLAPVQQFKVNEELHLGTIAANWEHTDTGLLEATPTGRIGFSKQAGILLKEPGLLEDDALAQVVGEAVNAQRDDKIDRAQLAVDNLAAVPITDQNAERVTKLREQAQNRLDAALEVSNQTIETYGQKAAAQELADRQKAQIEQIITDRMEADKLPWTMPDSQLKPEVMEAFRSVCESVLFQDSEAAPDDKFYVAPPMRTFEDGASYSPVDRALLATAGVDIEESLNIRREDLQRAGVFFVNRVGGGEQPLFGVPIPDPDSEGGVFNVQDRSFLTRAEFDKVYHYQQEHGYGIGDRDALDVQTDMLMFAMRPEGRKPGVEKSSSTSSRENKYGQVRSPFVDSSYLVKRGVEPVIFDEAEGRFRINTTVIHMVNAHPDYPGLSEMFDPAKTAHDQRYMSAGQFTRDFYIPPPTRQEALDSMQSNLPTKREYAWVGQWPEGLD